MAKTLLPLLPAFGIVLLSLSTGASGNEARLPEGPDAPAVADRVFSEPRETTSAAREVFRLHQAGVPEEVILAYIEDSGRQFYLPSDEIIVLTRAGLPSPLIVAMIRHGASATVPPPTNSSGMTVLQVVPDVTTSTSPPAPPPPVSTEPIFVTGPRARGVPHSPAFRLPPDPYLSPWFNGRFGYYPYSYYRRYQATPWSHPSLWPARTWYSPYSYRGAACGLSYASAFPSLAARRPFHRHFQRYAW